MVEWTALEMRRTLTGTLGSNPSLSAKKDTPKRCPFCFVPGLSPRGSSLRSGGRAGTNPSLSATKKATE